MSSRAREAEKRKQRREEQEALDQERREKDNYFSEIRIKLDDLGIDPHLLKEYLNYI